MAFIAKWAESYALEWLKDHLSFLPELVKSNREDIATLEKGNMLLWPNLTPEFRDHLLQKAAPLGGTILALDVEDICDIVMESLNENGLELKRDWVKANLLAFREELQSILI